MLSHRHPFYGGVGDWLDAAKAGDAARAYSKPDYYDTDLTDLDKTQHIHKFDRELVGMQGVGEYFNAADPMHDQPLDRNLASVRGWGGFGADTAVQAVTQAQAAAAAPTLAPLTLGESVKVSAYRGLLTGIFAYIAAKSITFKHKEAFKISVVLAGLDFGAGVLADYVKRNLAAGTKTS